jgi:hypothetical protein
MADADRRVDVLELYWFGRHEAERPTWVREVLGVFEAWLPEILPNTYSCLVAQSESVFSWDDFASFDLACRQDWVSWVGRPPALSGQISGLRSVAEYRKSASPAMFNTVHVGMELAAVNDSEMYRRVLATVAGVSAVVDPVYGYGAIAEAMLVTPGGLVGDRHSAPGSVDVMFGSQWRGIARDRVYIEWFGSEYVDVLPAAARNRGRKVGSVLLFEYPTGGHRRTELIPPTLIAPPAHSFDLAPLVPDFDDRGQRLGAGGTAEP